MLEQLIMDDVRSSLRTDRRHQFYLERFELGDTKQLRDKRILDIGSGDSNFLRIVKGVGLDPAYLERKPLYREKSVAGVCQSLPFKDHSFDITLACYSVFWIRYGLQDAIFEMLRVTKEGGLVQIYPVLLRRLYDTLYNPPEVRFLEKADETGKPAFCLIIKKEAGRDQYTREQLIPYLCRLVYFSPTYDPGQTNQQDSAKLARAIRRALY